MFEGSVSLLKSRGIELKEPIGKGAQGSIYKIFSEKYKSDFVLKLIKIDQENRDLVFTEVNTLRHLSHPNIIKLYDFFTDEEFLYVIFEYCPGGNLKTRIDMEGVLRGNQLRQVCTDLLNALLCCQDAKAAHRDIKPSNILFDSYDRAKLADFGLSSTSVQDDESHPIVGSIAYMAPELFNGQKNIDLLKADIWSLGITFFFMANGDIPWMYDNTRQLSKFIALGRIDYPIAMDRAFVQLLRKMLIIKPSSRANIEELLQDPFFCTAYQSKSEYSLETFNNVKHTKNIRKNLKSQRTLHTIGSVCCQISCYRRSLIENGKSDHANTTRRRRNSHLPRLTFV